MRFDRLRFDGYQISEFNAARPQRFVMPEVPLQANATELLILEKVRSCWSASIKLTQRELARITGLSLGMTNAVLKRLVATGWMSLSRHSARTITYLVTPEGQAELSRRYGDHLGRAIRATSVFGGRVEAFVADAKKSGVTRMVLIGGSTAEFILENACERHSLVFLKSADVDRWAEANVGDSLAIVFGELSAMSRSPAGLRGMSLDLATIPMPEPEHGAVL